MFDYQIAEYSVIGCLLIDERCFQVVREVLPNAEAFASESCRTLYETICRLKDSGKSVDSVIVGREAEQGNDFLSQCMEIVPTCNNAAEYARTVREGHIRRQLRDVAEKLETAALSPVTDTAQILTDARSALDALASTPGKNTVKSPYESLQDFLCFREDVKTGKRQAVKIGFPSIDGIMGGFAQGGLYIVAARPGVGKSAFGIAIADMLAKRHSVLYTSLEMTAEELNARRIAAVSDSPCSFGKLLFSTTSTDAEDASIINACGILAERNLYISAVSRLTVAELGIQARNVCADVVIVDYLGLLTGADRKAAEYEQITQISGDLKRLAKQLNCVVIALCQLNRESANNSGDNRPKLSHLRSSGAIEQDADGVMLLHRPEYGQENISRDPTAPQQFFVDVAKNRHGRTGTAELAWYAPVNRFEDRGGKWIVKSWV